GPRAVRGVVDDRELGADGDRLVLRDRDPAQNARSRGGDFGVHLVGGYLEQRLVRLDALALLLEPARDGALGDAFAKLGHGYRDLMACSDSFPAPPPFVPVPEAPRGSACT